MPGPIGLEDIMSTYSSLAALRADAGMTQVELAAAVGVGQGRISEWERGAHVPSARSIDRLAGALGVPAADVLESVIAYSLPETGRDGCARSSVPPTEACKTKKAPVQRDVRQTGAVVSPQVDGSL